MSDPGAIVALAAELVVVIAAASLFVVATTRPEFLGAGPGVRSVLQAAAVVMAVAAVFRGLFLEVDASRAALVAGRTGAAALIVLGALALGHTRARRALLAGAVLLAAAEVVYVVDADVAADVVRAGGGLAVGLTAGHAAQRSIAIRIAAVATALLLMVVLALSAVLSAVLTGTVADEALQRTEERAEIEAGILAQQADDAVGQAQFIEQVLVGAQQFHDAAATGSFEPLQDDLEGFRTEYRQVDFIAFLPTGGVTPVAAGIDQGAVVEMAGSVAVREAFDDTDVASVERLGRGLVALGATPVHLADEQGINQVVGVTVTGIRLNGNFLRSRLLRQRGTTFTLLGSDDVLASTTETRFGSPAEAVGATLSGAIAEAVLGSGRAVSDETSVRGDDAFVAVAPVRIHPNARPVAAIAVSTDADIVDDTRTSLFRTLFGVALAALSLAFVVAVVAGARLAAPVRRLTDTARRVAEGDLSARAQIEADDEIGVLGSTFDSMTGSIEEMTREIREAAAQTEAILGGMAEGLVATDPGGKVVALNPAAQSMLGVREAPALGKPVASIIKGHDPGGRSFATRLGAPMNRAWSINGTLTRRSGSLAVAMSGSPILDDDGELIGRVYVMRDIQREAELEAMKSEFLANISHELRTPLTPIKGYAEMMLSKPVPDDRRELFLTTILEGAERLERYVDMLVNFSAMQGGRFELQLEEIRAADVVRRVAGHWDSRSPDHRVDVKVNKRVPQVVADERLLERALNELMDNAIKYSPDGGTITLRVRSRGSGSTRRVEISVTDGGIGIRKGDLDAIFADFAQLDGSSTRRYGGLGLGLSFVHRVMHEHEGTLEATSEPDKGSVFTLSLPPSMGSAATPPAEAKPRRRGARRARRARSKR